MKKSMISLALGASAALAALLPSADGPSVTPGETVAIVFSGVNR